MFFSSRNFAESWLGVASADYLVGVCSIISNRGGGGAAARIHLHPRVFFKPALYWNLVLIDDKINFWLVFNDASILKFDKC